MKPPRDIPQPPRPLGEHGANLWNSIQIEYAIDDAAGIEYLATACSALDLAERLREQIERDGVTVKALRGRGPRSHPSVKDELSARMLVTRCLSRLGIGLEPLKESGGQRGVKRKNEDFDDADE
jgi:hypothetical protein